MPLKVNMSYTLNTSGGHGRGGSTSRFGLYDLEPEWDIPKQRWIIRQDGFVAEAESLHLAVPLWLSVRDGYPVECEQGCSYYEDLDA